MYELSTYYSYKYAHIYMYAVPAGRT